MNYPIWDIPAAGGGLLIAIIATIHVYVAHFAIGGGLFLVLTEIRARREDGAAMLDYLRAHGRFFLLLTMVFGAVTGVGIWFVVAVVHPAVTETLIHMFVFAWATEWVFFVGEIAALFVWVATFDRMEPRRHVIVGWLYFAFAWLSLFVINGILAFMLTPGDWPADPDFWRAFFNPSMWPALAFRTLVAVALAGLFGFVTAAFVRDGEARLRLLRYCARWLIVPLLLLPAAAYWYFSALPDLPRSMLLGRSPELRPFVAVLAAALPVLVAGGLVMATRLPATAARVLAFVLLAAGLVYFGAFEWIREGARRPFVIPGHMYSNAVIAAEVPAIEADGMLARARWVSARKITDANRLETGRELFRLECQSCHTIGGAVNDILPRTAGYDAFGAEAMLDGLGVFSDYMPRFFGTQAEREALAAWIVAGLHGRPLAGPPAPPPAQRDVAPAPFDPATAEHVLLAWSDFGMRWVSGCDGVVAIRSPKGGVQVQLVRRGPGPSLAGDGPRIDIRAEDGEGPYPVLAVEARDGEGGRLLASTKAVSPEGVPFGCSGCHGGERSAAGGPGDACAAARDVLAVHDRIEGTALLAGIEDGRPAECDSCHRQALAGAEGQTGPLGLSASMHGWHAHFLTGRGAEACAACHAPSPGEEPGRPRGRHGQAGIDCTSCHGALEDHAAALLAAEALKGNEARARRLLSLLHTRAVATPREVRPREAWIQQPDCLGCHPGFGAPESDSAFGAWTADPAGLYRFRADEAGLRCPACHGASHAIYPARSPLGADRDNLAPLQYQGLAGTLAAGGRCAVCHREGMADSIHHPNMAGSPPEPAPPPAP